MTKRWFAFAALLGICALGAVAQTPAGGEKKFTADVHKEKGLACTDCHGEGAKKPVQRTKCQECHGEYKDLAKLTEGVEPNPHYNHTIDLDCNSCHHMHKPAEVYCNRCHQQLQFSKPAAAKEGK